MKLARPLKYLVAKWCKGALPEASRYARGIGSRLKSTDDTGPGAKLPIGRSMAS
jgi:hypothetical protein